MRKLIRHIIPEEKKISLLLEYSTGRFIFVLNCFVLFQKIFILSLSVELQQAVFSLGELIPLPKLSFPLCVGQGHYSCRRNAFMWLRASFSCSYFFHRQPGLCCEPVLIFDCWSEFQVPHFHAAIDLNCRQVVPWKCKDSLDFCPHFLKEPRATNVCVMFQHVSFGFQHTSVQPVPL